MQKILHHALLTRKKSFIFLIVLMSYLSGVGDAMELANQPLVVKNKPIKKIEINKAYSQSTASESGQSIVQIKEVSVGQEIFVQPTQQVIKEPEENQQGEINSANELLVALNSYRQKKGVGPLVWDSKLAIYAQERANFFVTSGGLDSHAGFRDFINNQDGFRKLGYMGLGENSSFGYSFNETKIIEEAYAKSAAHNDNQLSNAWSHVGIGVSGNATNLVFGGKKM